jgi:hypothetical protein
MFSFRDPRTVCRAACSRSSVKFWLSLHCVEANLDALLFVIRLDLHRFGIEGAPDFVRNPNT